MLQLLPLLLDAVQAVEKALPISGQGQKKLDFVISVLKAGFHAASGSGLASGVSWEKLLSLLIPMINEIVELKNSYGLFSTSHPSAPTSCIGPPA
jgi:hypothetical protein